MERDNVMTELYDNFVAKLEDEINALYREADELNERAANLEAMASTLTEVKRTLKKTGKVNTTTLATCGARELALSCPAGLVDHVAVERARLAAGGKKV